MKNLWWVLLLAGGLYAYRAGYFETMLPHQSTRGAANTQAGGSASTRQAESAPRQMMEMQQAIGDGPSGLAGRGYIDAARHAAAGGSSNE